ncbi:hypothetical protein BDN72DRAFT_858252 [Pluteus cervinus]|uniref:Uncharacterized protein n=1 Tax=Pluteus cervinus TaxID=181527 RepID=A0ACD3ASB7_9AGAR|nr:hypothetical protein BDN72DRAFT_858252 [Pluteus cervinus]
MASLSSHHNLLLRRLPSLPSVLTDDDDELPVTIQISARPSVPLLPPLVDVYELGTREAAVRQVDEWLTTCHQTQYTEFNEFFVSCDRVLRGLTSSIYDFKDKEKRLSEVFLDLQCSICLEPFNRPITTDCEHSFCSGCLSMALRAEFRKNVEAFVVHKKKSVDDIPWGSWPFTSEDELAAFLRQLRDFLELRRFRHLRSLLTYTCPICRTTFSTQPRILLHLPRVSRFLRRHPTLCTDGSLRLGMDGLFIFNGPYNRALMNRTAAIGKRLKNDSIAHPKAHWKTEGFVLRTCSLQCPHKPVSRTCLASSQTTIFSPLIMEDACKVLSSNISQLPGYTVKGDEIVFYGNKILPDLYRDLQTYVNRPTDLLLDSSTSHPYQLPRPHPPEGSSVCIYDITSTFSLWSMKTASGPMRPLYEDRRFLVHPSIMTPNPTPLSGLDFYADVGESLDVVNGLWQKFKQNCDGELAEQHLSQDQRWLASISNKAAHFHQLVWETTQLDREDHVLLSIQLRQVASHVDANQRRRRKDLKQLGDRTTGLDDRMTRLDDRMTGLDDRMTTLATVGHHNLFRYVAIQRVSILVCLGLLLSNLYITFGWYTGGPSFPQHSTLKVVQDNDDCTPRLITSPHQPLPPFSRGDGYKIALEV